MTEGTDGYQDDHGQLRRLLEEASGATGPVDAVAGLFGVRRRVRRRRVARAGAAVVAAAGLVAGVVYLPGSGRPRPGPLVASGSGPYRLAGALTSFSDCSAYLSYVKGRAESLVGPYGLPSTQAGTSFDVNGGTVRAAPPLFSSAGGSLDGLPGLAAGAAAAPAATAYSGTNDQVPGVDEPDTTKTNGSIVVTLDGSTLRVLDRSARVLGAVQLGGDTGGGLLLDGTTAVVLSAPSEASGPPGGPVGVARPYGGPAPAQPSTATAAVVDLSDPAHPALLRTFVFDGSLVAARLVGGEVQIVDRTDGPRLSFATPTQAGDQAAAAAANRQLIAASTLSDWLPAWQVRGPDGATTARRPLPSCAAVARPAVADGISTLSVFELDPQASTPSPATSVVGAGTTVYDTGTSLYVAGHSAVPADGAGPVQYGCCTVVPPPGATTTIYAFATPAGGQPVFEASGQVPGWLIGSYAMDQAADGTLRVASTERGGAGSDSMVSVLARSGSALITRGSVSGLGDGEAIRAVRFIGSDAYVVTFRSFDPLYVVDLQNPSAPRVVGQLDQPGFSEFLYPLPGGRLIGVGVTLTGNEPTGLAAATYDVSDPARPRRISSVPLASGYFWDGYDPHAFLWWAPASLALIATPGGYSTAGTGVSAFRIGADGTLGPATGIGHDGVTASRSLVIGATVWVVTSAGVVTAPLADLADSTWHAY